MVASDDPRAAYALLARLVSRSCVLSGLISDPSPAFLKRFAAPSNWYTRLLRLRELLRSVPWRKAAISWTGPRRSPAIHTLAFEIETLTPRHYESMSPLRAPGHVRTSVRPRCLASSVCGAKLHLPLSRTAPQAAPQPGTLSEAHTEVATTNNQPQAPLAGATDTQQPWLWSQEP